MTILMIILIVLIIISLIGVLVSIVTHSLDGIVSWGGLFLMLIIVDAVFYYCVSNQPKEDIIPAIEVYRGNTTLQITYQDGIPIDSIVVYNN